MSSRENDGSEHPPAHEKASHPGPPMCRRFKESGNPKGRPKGAKNRKTIVKTVADEMHSVTESGTRRRRSTLELVLLRLRIMALVATRIEKHTQGVPGLCARYARVR